MNLENDIAAEKASYFLEEFVEIENRLYDYISSFGSALFRWIQILVIADLNLDYE